MCSMINTGPNWDLDSIGRDRPLLSNPRESEITNRVLPLIPPRQTLWSHVSPGFTQGKPLYPYTILGIRSVAAVGPAAIMSLALLAPPVQGQWVDYGALQQLFKEPVTTSVTGPPHSLQRKISVVRARKISWVS